MKEQRVSCVKDNSFVVLKKTLVVVLFQLILMGCHLCLFSFVFVKSSPKYWKEMPQLHKDLQYPEERKESEGYRRFGNRSVPRSIDVTHFCEFLHKIEWDIFSSLGHFFMLMHKTFHLF